MRLPATLKGCRGAVFDTMFLIYLLEDHPRYATVCEWLLGRAEANEFSGVITPITAAELIVKPLKAGRRDIADRYRMAVRSLPNCSAVNFTLRTGTMAGALRAEYGFHLPDAFQIACAMEHGGVIITNDASLKKATEVHVVMVDSLLT